MHMPQVGLPMTSSQCPVPEVPGGQTQSSGQVTQFSDPLQYVSLQNGVQLPPIFVPLQNPPQPSLQVSPIHVFAAQLQSGFFVPGQAVPQSESGQVFPTQVLAAQLQFGPFVPGQLPPQPSLQVSPTHVFAAQLQSGFFVPGQSTQPLLQVSPTQVFAAQSQCGFFVPGQFPPQVSLQVFPTQVFAAQLQFGKQTMGHSGPSKEQSRLQLSLPQFVFPHSIG